MIISTIEAIEPEPAIRQTFPYLLRHKRTGAVILATGKLMRYYSKPRYFDGHAWAPSEENITGFIVRAGETWQEVGKRWNSAKIDGYEPFDGVIRLENEVK